MQQDLTILEQRWGLALQSASFGVWDLDLPSQQVHYSPQWKALLGYDDSDTPDTTALWRSRVHPEDLGPMLDALAGQLEPGAPGYATEFRLRAADGAYRWVLSRGRVVEHDAEGRPLRMVGTLTDLTERREAESLRLARDRAEAAHRAKNEFLSRMSHELRTPLNAVLGFAQLLAQQIGQGDETLQRSWVAHIEQAGWQLLTMIDNVLDLSLVESGRMELQIEAVAIAPLLQSACAALAPLAQRRGVRIEPPQVGADVVVRADATRLAQVLTHLLGNAILYNHDGGTVRVDAAAAPAGWTLAVSDTGCGIPAAQLPHLFEPFNRLGRAASGIEGVGIGLVLTRWLVDTMGGRLTVQSQEGQGSTFAVTLPGRAEPGAGAG